MAWEEVDGKLELVVKKKDFVEAMAFVNQVADIAEELNHHPDIDIRWNTVTLRLSTHSAGNVVTDNDRDLAARIDGLAG